VNVPFLELKPGYEAHRAEFDAAYSRVMGSGRYLFGPELDAFEEEYRKSIGSAYCVGVANGLEALQMLLMALDIGPGDEVIVPSNGYIATWLAVSHVGARIVPCEPDSRTYNIDPDRLNDAITPRTKAIMPIHLYGQPADMRAINAIAADWGIPVLEDAAQSHGAKCFGKEAGSLGFAAGTSFYPSKNMGAFADAGAVSSSDQVLAEKVRCIRNYGSKERYYNEMIGLNSRMSELQAAFLRVKLLHLPSENDRRKTNAKTYLARLPNLPVLTLPFVPDWAEPVWHLFVVRTPRRDELREYLSANRIATQIHYPVPPHLSQAYKHLGFKKGAFPIAELLASEVMSLPIGPYFTEPEIDYVCARVTSFFGR
jgi:dTDP-4-amino-4,6-dideoxygalactose transaminase